MGMPMDIIEEFKEFLISYLRGKKSSEARSYPWKESMGVCCRPLIPGRSLCS